MSFGRIITTNADAFAPAEQGFAAPARTVEPTPWLLADLPAPSRDGEGAGPNASGPTHEEYVSAAARAAEEAYARGHADGVALGHDEARHELAAPLAAVAMAIEQISAAQARFAVVAEERLVSLALGVARHLVEREVEADPEILRRLIDRALADFPAAQGVTVRMNPDDLARLQSVPTAILPASNELAFVADTRIGCGGCVLEGPDRIVDSRVETAIERIYRHLAPAAA